MIKIIPLIVALMFILPQLQERKLVVFEIELMREDPIDQQKIYKISVTDNLTVEEWGALYDFCRKTLMKKLHE